MCVGHQQLDFQHVYWNYPSVKIRPKSTVTNVTDKMDFLYDSMLSIDFCTFTQTVKQWDFSDFV